MLTRLVVLAGLVVFLFGCIQERSMTGHRQLIVPEGEAYERIERLEETPGAPLLRETSLSLSFSLVGLGEVAYDGFTLPLVQPSSKVHRIAVQGGVRPSWKALLARSSVGADASSVSIYEVREGASPRLISSHPGPLILGRTSNNAGALVERPNPDGSRWIGIAPWNGSAITWLVADQNVNAFAWIGPNGTLAYSSRSQGESRFQLVIKSSDGTTWTLPESLPYSWILPTIDLEGDGLFALRLGDGYLDLAWGRFENAAFFRQTLSVHRASDRVDMQRAWQMLAGATGGAGLAPGELLWFSYELGRLVSWRIPKNQTFLMPENSVAAYSIGSKNEWLVTSTNGLDMVVFLQGSTAQTTLFQTPWIARGGSPKSPLIVYASGSKLALARLETNATTGRE